jgi:hypothetical protein
MNSLDSVRAAALKEVDRAQRNFRLAFFGAVFFELVFLVAFLMTADLRNRDHLVLLFGIGLIYEPLVLGLVALGAHMNRCTLRVLARLDDLSEETRRSA